jgi:hypothetical protein
MRDRWQDELPEAAVIVVAVAAAGWLATLVVRAALAW